MQRIYGVAFRNREDLKAYLTMLEEAAKRDHRKLGKEMELFHLQEEAPGMIFWHPNGWTIYRALEDYMRRRLGHAGYKEIRTPQVVDRILWERSGHWEAYRENMFIVEVDEEGAKEKRINALKPMNCPCHVQVFQPGAQVLPRPAAAPRRVRIVPPLRKLGLDARADAGPRLHAG